MTQGYVLDSARRVRAVGLREWAEWMAAHPEPLRVVGQATLVPPHRELRPVELWTIFLGMDLSLGHAQEALTFETCVWDVEGITGCHGPTHRAATWKEAESDFRLWVREVAARIRGRLLREPMVKSWPEVDLYPRPL